MTLTVTILDVLSEKKIMLHVRSSNHSNGKDYGVSLPPSHTHSTTDSQIHTSKHHLNLISHPKQFSFFKTSTKHKKTFTVLKENK